MRSRVSFSVAAILAAMSSVRAQESDREEIIVTSTALRETALNVAQPTTVLAGDELRREVAGSLGETLAAQPGISASYFGPSASRPIIRGLSGDRVLMLHDGVSALDVSTVSQDHAVSIEPVLADQIEVLKGPASLLYGSGAVGGIVNVIDGRIPTEFGSDANSGALEVRGDTAMEERTAVGRMDFGSESLRFHIDGYHRETDDIEIPGFALSPSERAEHLAEGEAPEELARGTLPNSASDTKGGAAGISYGRDDNFFGIAWSRFDTRYGIPVPHEHHDAEEEEAEPDVQVDMQQDRYDLKGERKLDAGPFSAVRVRGTYNTYTHRELEGTEIGTVFDQDAYDVRVNLDHGVKAGWRGTFGAQYTDIDFTAAGAEAFIPPSKTQTFGVFVFEERDLGAFALELGGRLEQQQIDADVAGGALDYDELAYNLSAGTVWKAADDYSVALNLTRSQRHPQAAELFSNGPHIASGRFEVGAASLQHETANTVDLTLHRHADAGIHWSVSTYYNDYADYIFSSPTGEEQDGLPVFRYTQADAKFYGFEGEISFPLVDTDGQELELRLASDYVRGKLKSGDNLPQMPPLRYGAELHYERDRLHLGLQSFYYAKQDDTAANERDTSAYTMLDADASYRFDLPGSTQLLAFVRGTNLLDEDARRHTSPLKEVAPLPGLSISAGLRASF